MTPINWLFATHEQASHPNDNPIPNKYGKLTNIQTGRLCQRRRLDTEASRLIVRRIRFGAKEGAEVEAAGVRAHFWKVIKNHKTSDYMAPDAWLGVTSSWLVITNTRFAFGYPANALSAGDCY